MAISDSHAMHRMPAASAAATAASESSSTNKTISSDKGSIRGNCNIRPTPQEKKWHYLQQQQQHSWQPTNTDSTLGSTLSRSMRYADPWLRSTDGGGCGAKYDTVRCYSSSYSGDRARGGSHSAGGQQRRAGTVRVTSLAANAGRGRPTVLPSRGNVIGDPYDLVRRSRLGRSVSPNGTGTSKGIFNNGYTSVYATFGRRSILECDVNPYDLMDNQPAEQASSITCVNGQRIRVRPFLSNVYYEDVINPLAGTTSTQPQRLPDSRYSHSINNNNSSCNNVESTKIVIGSTNTGTTLTTFKSILKKKSASKCEESEETTLPSRLLNDSINTSTRSQKTSQNRLVNTDHLNKRNGITAKKICKNSTQFYIPMPSSNCCTDTNSSPRKKVQFLMSPEKNPIPDDEYQNIIKQEKEEHSSSTYNNINGNHTLQEYIGEISTSTEPIASIPPTSQFRLQRSISERLSTKQAIQKIVFHDSMALRSRGTATNQQDARTLFSINSTDLERLDGVSKTIKNKQNHCKRPDVPPPEPPIVQSETSNKQEMPHISGECNNIKVVLSPIVPPRKRSNNKQPSVVDNIMKISHRIQIHHELPSDGVDNCTSNVSVVGVSSLSTEVPLTTSILIGPDNHCYSTVNLNRDDCYPHYRSSVVVVVGENGVTANGNNYNSSKVYITNTPTVCEEISARNDAYEEVNNNCASVINEGIEQQHKYEDIVYTDATTDPELLSYEVLQNLLCDPVEAVRRNLVPHVCGKDIDVNGAICKNRKSNSKDEIAYAPVNPEEETPQIVPITELTENDANAYVDGAYEALNGSTTSSDCYSNQSSVTEDDLHARNNKFYELLADATLAHVSSDLDLELDLDLAYSNTNGCAVKSAQPPDDDHHHYESISMIDQTKLSEKLNNDPIYEDIDMSGGSSVVPPPLPTQPPPTQLIDDLHVSAEYTTRSIFEGASKYDILSYLVDAKERGCANEAEESNEQQENPYIKEGASVTFTPINTSIDQDTSDVIQPVTSCLSSNNSANLSTPRSTEIERNDSGVGSETSKCSLSKYRNGSTASSCSSDSQTKVTLQCCEDCDNEQENENNNEDSSNFVVSADGSTLDDTLQLLVCGRCTKRRIERREIIMEIVETEEKYMRDLQIILEEFYHPMLIAGLLTPDQLQAIFVNIEELVDNSTLLSDRLRDTVDMAVEQGDEDLLQVDIGRLFLDAGVQMLHAFEVYCVRQGGAALLLAGLEKEKELLRVFLRVSQMENVVLRRMNLSSFLMVPVQRVTKYPLLLARLYKVTPIHQEDSRSRLHEAQHTIELHLNHINSQTHNIPTKLWRRLNSTPSNSTSTGQSKQQLGGHTTSVELVDLVGIKLRKIAVDVLDWNHEEATFVLEGRLLVTQPQVEGHHQWRKGRTIKLSPVCAILVTCGGRNNANKRSYRKGPGYVSYGTNNGFGKLMTLGQKFNGQVEKEKDEELVFPARQKNHDGGKIGGGTGKSLVREAALLLLRDKGGRHSLLREPLYLDRCVVAADPAWQSYFEIQELHHTITSSSTVGQTNSTTCNNSYNMTGSNGSNSSYSGNATYIFRAEDDAQTRIWYKQLQYYAQGMGAWRRRRNALPNIMIAGLGLR